MTASQPTGNPTPAPAPAPAPAAASGHVFVYSPALDIRESPEGLVLEADLPGVAPENLHLVVENNVLRIYGKVSWPIPGDARLLYEEVQPADFFRSFILSDEVDTDRIEADFQDGVLRLSLPRAAKTLPRKIEVRSGRPT
ncbi:MAG TPA: Hsp20/alpha crystallin family protein [Gemmatales bacterium]|nr:Hsp20/alpha crystallin family protein [Gemmatales bacterium]HMP60341.1 Hsp20/alpha crystallin family protein [Gemmatales bacterium]